MNEQEIRAIVRDEIGWAMPQSTKTGILASVVDIRGFDPTGEGSAYQPEPAPGSDAEHPPLGYRLAMAGEKRMPGYVWWNADKQTWRPDSASITMRIRREVLSADCPVANPIPANEGDGRADSVAIPVGWVKVGTLAKGPGVFRAHESIWIKPDPSIPWGDGYEAILPDEAQCGDEYKDRHQWREWTHPNNEMMYKPESFPWRRRCQSLPGSGPQLREAVQAIQESAEPTPEPAPGSDAEHPPLGYRLVPVGKARNDGYIFWRHGQWNVGGQVFFGHSVCEGDCPVANPIPAADGDSQASEHRVFVPVVGYSWIPGTPPAPYASEWFFAKLDTGEAVALRELPAGHSYDYKTADETFFSNGRVVAWMQNPDSEYVAHVTDGASQICAECAKLRIENAGHRDEISYLHAIAQRETERADASTGRAVLAERKLAELRAELETTKRLLAESLVAQNRLETLRDALREAMR